MLCISYEIFAFCGYDAFLDEKLSESSKGDLKESFMFNENGTSWPHYWKDLTNLTILKEEKCSLSDSDLIK